MDTFKSNYTEISNITLYVNNPSLISSGKFQHITPEIEETSWYQAAINSSGEVIWVYSTSENSYTNIQLVRYISTPFSNNDAVLVIGISNNYLRSMFANIRLHTIISLNNSEVVYSDYAHEIGTALPFKLSDDLWNGDVYSTSYNGSGVLAYDSSLNALYSNDKFQIITISENLKEVRKTILIFVFILLIAILFPLFLIIFFTDLYSRRVNTVREEMHKVAQGDLNITHSITGTDELGELFNDMNSTIAAIQALNEEIFNEKLMKKDLENQQQKIQFELLSNQINPHFLFNTLESIRMQAAINGQTELTIIIMELGKLLRFSLEHKDKLVPLSHEIEYLHAYFEIQHFRFKDRINYELHISPKLDLNKILVLPLILQPIVENAFTHGLSSKKDGGYIDINILTRENNLLITIHDNGVGMTTQKFNELNQKLNQEAYSLSNSIGICNVHNRIRLFYGVQYGISLFSELTVGTTVTIKLPFGEDNSDESIIY
jgi:two-component system sensor histidine kinase YesM